MAHTLTFNYDDPSSGYTVRKGSISGEYVHSPYTLQNGDELYFQTVKINNTINGTSYSSSDLENTTLEFVDVDINIVGASGPQLGITPFVLKYTESGGSTLTFKHFFDAGLQGTGTYKFRHYSQQEPSSGETWVLNESLSDTTDGMGFSVDISFTSYSRTYTTIKLLLRASRDGVIVHYDSTEVYNSIIDDGWYDQDYRTITFDEPVTDSTLLAWLQANGVKQ